MFDERNIENLEAIDKAINAARDILWQKLVQKENDKWDWITRRMWHLSKPKEPTIIAQDAIEWDIFANCDKSAEDGG